jgi:hypothetical protein
LAATAYIQELLCASVEQVSFERVDFDDDGDERKLVETLHVIKCKSTLQSDEDSTSSTLVVPPGTRGAWKAVRESFQPGMRGQRFLVVGSAGIGKSRSINYQIRELISERRQDSTLPLPTIVFEHRKDGRVWKFTPRDSRDHTSDYEASIMSTKHFSSTMEPALNNPDNVYIVDSGKAEDSKDPSLLRAKTIFVCSPDGRHFDEWLKHIQLGGKFFIPFWTPEAIVAAQPLMFQHTDVQTLKNQVAVVGPYPRRLASPESFEEYKANIDRAMQKKRGSDSQRPCTRSRWS